MLTKEERAAIAKTAESLSDYTLYYSEIYKCLYGEYPRNDMPNMEYDKAIIDRIVDLCNTSNMLELPRDKDGEIIHIHDVVYDNTGMEWEVREFRFPFDGACIYARTDNDYSTFRPDELTHKRPVTIASVRKQLKHVLDKGEMTSWSMAKLFDIADQLESLSDKDE